MYGRPASIVPDVAAAEIAAFADASAFDSSLPYTRHYRFRPTDDLGVPAVVAWGTRERLLIGAQPRRARSLLPGARHVRLPGCGHVAMRDDPEAVAELILTT